MAVAVVSPHFSKDKNPGSRARRLRGRDFDHSYLQLQDAAGSFKKKRQICQASFGQGNFSDLAIHDGLI